MDAGRAVPIRPMEAGRGQNEKFAASACACGAALDRIQPIAESAKKPQQLALPGVAQGETRDRSEC